MKKVTWKSGPLNMFLTCSIYKTRLIRREPLMFKRETSTMSHKTMFIKYGCSIRDVNPSRLKCIWNGGSPSFYLISVTPLDPLVAGKRQDIFFFNFEFWRIFFCLSWRLEWAYCFFVISRSTSIPSKDCSR